MQNREALVSEEGNARDWSDAGRSQVMPRMDGQHQRPRSGEEVSTRVSNERENTFLVSSRKQIQLCPAGDFWVLKTAI